MTCEDHPRVVAHQQYMEQIHMLMAETVPDVKLVRQSCGCLNVIWSVRIAHIGRPAHRQACALLGLEPARTWIRHPRGAHERIR